MIKDEMVYGKILIVEDQVTLEGDPLKQKLIGAGYHVIEKVAKTREEAIEIALREKPKIIFMDIILKNDEFGGVRAAHEIQKKISAHFIYLTGAPITRILLKEVKKTNSYDFLTKPIDKEQMLATVSLAGLRKFDTNLVFICYSHKEIEKEVNMIDEMLAFIEPLSNVGVDNWIDTKIQYGADWKEEIDEALQQSKAAILLVSIDFIGSRFITKFELPELLKAAKSRGTLILPVFLGHVPKDELQRLGLHVYQAINDPKDPLYTWSRPKRDKHAWMELYNRLRVLFSIQN